MSQIDDDAKAAAEALGTQAHWSASLAPVGGQVFPFAAVRGAISGFFGDAAGARTCSALAEYRGEDPIQGGPVRREEIGPLILLCALSGVDAVLVSDLPLFGVLLHCETDGRQIDITTDQAMAHPLLERWLTPSLGEMVTRIAMMGATMENAAHGAPQPSPLEIVDTAGYIFAVWTLRFNTPAGVVAAHLKFGIAVPCTNTYTVHRITGDGVFSVGVAVANPTVLQPAAPPVPHSLPLDAATLCAVLDEEARAFDAGMANLPHGLILAPGNETVH